MFTAEAVEKMDLHLKKHILFTGMYNEILRPAYTILNWTYLNFTVFNSFCSLKNYSIYLN